MNLRVLLVSWVFMLTACQQDDAAFDVGLGKYSQTICIAMQDGLQACYGPGWSEGVKRKIENYDIYSVYIEKRHTGGSTELFTREFSAEEVLPSVLTPENLNVVKVDGQRVEFMIQESPFVVNLSDFEGSM